MLETIIESNESLSNIEQAFRGALHGLNTGFADLCTWQEPDRDQSGGAR